MKTPITCLFIYGNFTFFFPLTYNFLCLHARDGPISHSRIVFWTPKSEIKEWKFDGVDEGACRSEKNLTNGKIFSLFQAFR